jgi:hypothetical protein
MHAQRVEILEMSNRIRVLELAGRINFSLRIEQSNSAGVRVVAKGRRINPGCEDGQLGFEEKRMNLLGYGLFLTNPRWE